MVHHAPIVEKPIKLGETLRKGTCLEINAKLWLVGDAGENDNSSSDSR
jgi:hypothetical protein